jgi:hypothetical protein
MRKRLILVVSLAVLLGLVNSASADIELKVDFAYPKDLCSDVNTADWDPNWQDRHDLTAKYIQDANWTTAAEYLCKPEDPCEDPYWITMPTPANPRWYDVHWSEGDATFYDIGGSGIDMTLACGHGDGAALHVCGMHWAGKGTEPNGWPDPNTDPICNSEIVSARFRGPGRRGRDGSILLTFHRLPHGSYVLKGYHNDLVFLELWVSPDEGIEYEALDPRVMPAIAVTGDGVIQIHDGDTNDVNVPIYQETSDANLFARGPSVVKFDFTGPGPVEVEYRTPWDGGDKWGGAAVLNAFILQGVSDGTAYEPNVPDGTTDVHPDPNVDPNKYWKNVNPLTWMPGEYAVHHEVYFGIDEAAVFNATDPNILPGRGRQNPCSYKPPAPLDLDTTYYWRIDEVKDGHPNSPWKGKVWSFTTSDGKASGPSPGNNSTNADVYTTLLQWSAGAVAAQHDVYFGTDEAVVFNAADPNLLPGRGRRPKDPCSYGAGMLEYGKTYYWRIDEVNSVYGIAKGDVWRFTAINNFVVDDMEEYDYEENLLENVWWDGYPDYSGSDVALGDASADPVHGGSQSMIYYYDNNIPDCPNYSEIEASTSELEIGSNWAVSGVEALVLFFYGDPDAENDANEQMYLGLKDNGNKYAEVRYGDNGEDMNDIKIDEWQQWNIRLQDFTDINGVYLGNIQKVYIGFGDRENPVPGGSGLVYFDDLRLYLSRCVPSIIQPEFDLNNDCIVDFRDANVMVTDWLQDAYAGEIAPPDANGLLVEYLFDNDFNDTSGNGYHAVDHGDYPDTYVADGNLVLSGERVLYGYDLSYVGIPLGADNPFWGGRNYSIQMTFRSTGGQILLTSAHPTPPEHQDEDHSMMFYNQKREGWENRTPVVHFLRSGELNQESIVDFNDGRMHTVVLTYDTLTATMRYYDDGYQDRTWKVRYGMPWYDEHVVRIGGCKARGLVVELPVPNFSGQIDSFRIYDYVLSEPEVMYLATNGTGIRPIASPANVYDKELPAQRTVNFRDYAILLEAWLEKTYWP